MTFDEKLDALVSALEANTAALNEVIGLTKEGGAAAPKTTTTRKKKDDAATNTAGTTETTTTETTTTSGTVDVDPIRKEIGAWLAEFAKDEDKTNPEGRHPEVTARSDALRKALDGLKVEKITEIKVASDLERLVNWFGKAKVADKGFGIGRFAADPEPAGDDASEDLDI